MERENHGNNTWLGGYDDSVDPVSGTGIQNVRFTTSGDIYIYDGTPVPPPVPPVETEKKKFPWFIYYNRWRRLGR